MGDSKDHRPETVPVPGAPELEGAATQIAPHLGPSYPPGALIGDRYRVLATLGVGGMGVVYRVHDTVLDLELALKMLRPEMARDEAFLKRFRNELIVARQVTHRHVVRNHDLGTHEGAYFMTMDLVEGRSLRQVLKDEGRLAPERAIVFVRQIAAALAEAHRSGIVHRDLKPANIMIDAEGDAFVTDFGIARALGGAQMTRTGEVVGTPDYLSPEQARGEKVDGRSDLYTLGIMFIEMLSGKLPFPGGTLLEILSQRMQGKVASLEELGVEVSPELTRVIERCVEGDLERRYASAEELIGDLDALDRRTPPPRAAPRRRRSPAVGVGVLVAALLGVGGFLAYRLLFAPVSQEATVPLVPQPPPVVAVVPAPRHSVAVLPLSEVAGREELEWASKGVAEMLATALAESESLRVVDSVRVFQVLQDLGFEPQRMRQGELSQVADFFQVDRLVLGQLQGVGEEVQLDLQLLDVARPDSAQRVSSESGAVEELFAMVDRLGTRLLEALDVPEESSVPGSLTVSATAMQAYTEGLESLSRRETLKAAPALERAVAQDPRFTIAWVRLSQAYQSLGRYDEALEAAKRGVESAAGPESRIAYEARAQDALLRGETEAAQGFLEGLVAGYPNDSGAHIALAEAYGQQGKFADAVASLKQAVLVDPSEPRGWYLLGRYAIQSGDSKAAIDEYLVRALVQQNRLRNEQGQAEVHNALGVGYERLGLIEEAAESYQKAGHIRHRIGDHRGLAVSLHNLFRIHLQRGDHEAAEENIRQALDIHTELGNQVGIGKVTNSYGALEEERGRYAEALDYYRRSLQVRSELGDERALAESYANVGAVYHLLGQDQNALLYLERALGLFEKNDDAAGKLFVLPNLGICKRAQGDWPAALGQFLQALELSREIGRKDVTAITQGNLGQVARYQGRYAAAFSSYEQALAMLGELGFKRGQVEITLWRTGALLELGALGRVEAELEKLAALGENGHRSQEQRATVLALRGGWHQGRGEVAQARELLAEALNEAESSQSQPSVVEIEIALGRAALEAGEAGLALTSLSEALAEATRLGNARLELLAGEAAALAALANGDLGLAEEGLRQALRVAERVGSYSRSFRLRHLLAEVLTRRGTSEAASREWQAAQAELARVRDNLDDDLRITFDQLPEVAELLTGSGG